MICEQSNQELIEVIEVTRQQMVLAGLKYGFTHPDTVQLSTQLDELLNELEKLNNKKHMPSITSV